MRLSIYVLLGALVSLQATSIDNCTCGFRDPSTGILYTDAIIVYFNETQGIPDDVFFAEEYIHKSEMGWSTIYRQGAVLENAMVSNSFSEEWYEGDRAPDTLQLFVDPSTPQHLVNGGSIKTRRQDILYGSFRASMRSPWPWNGGSALSMMLYHNYSSSIEADIWNAEVAGVAAVTALLNSQYPNANGPQQLNYSMSETTSNVIAAVSPWDFNDLQIDWHPWNISFHVPGLAPFIPSKNQTIAHEPLPLYFRHWSTGGAANVSEGPPAYRSVAEVGWVRAFFNSSLTTDDERKSIDDTCHAAQTCSTEDMTLRGSSPYPPEALLPWVEPPRSKKWQLPSAIVSGSGVSIGIMLLINVLIRRVPWNSMLSKKHGTPASVATDTTQTVDFDQEKKTNVVVLTTSASCSTLGGDQRRAQKSKQTTQTGAGMLSGPATPVISSPPLSTKQKFSSEQQKDPEDYFSLKGVPEKKLLHADWAEPGLNPKNHPNASDHWQESAATLIGSTPEASMLSVQKANLRARPKGSAESSCQTIRPMGTVDPSDDEIEVIMNNPPPKSYQGVRAKQRDDPEVKEKRMSMGRKAFENTLGLGISWYQQEVLQKANKEPPNMGPYRQPPVKQQIDYLAGLVTMACIGITLIHFSLSFVPFAGGLSTGIHYKSEYWARWSVSPVILDPIWLGPIFVTSCRFLAGKYLKSGKLADVAQKILLRAPRLLVPCLIVAMLEYFFIEEGLTSKLEWLPSVSWSTWVYVQDYPNFGWFLNETLELAYLIPNKAPAIINHYCVGVLWTVPVQLQYSYTTLIAAVMVREIKSPWKRFSFSMFCIVNNWYALSWGSCFWLGVVLADLQMTYKYNEWIMARPAVKWPLFAFLWIVLISAPLFSLLEDRLSIPIMTWERGLHPDPETGLPTSQTPRASYPTYFEPRLNTLLFAGGVQILVECSTWFQSFLSWKPWLLVFPHTYTIYLIHGFIFWSLGAWIMVTLANTQLPYWSTVLITFLCCYTTIILSAMVLTPFCEGSAQAASKNIWRWASEEPVPKRPTLTPYPKDLFLAEHDHHAPDVEATPEIEIVEVGGKKTPEMEVREFSTSSKSSI